jgi:hypothetical protein
MWLRFWHRPRAEKWLAWQTLMLSLLSAIALRLISFRRWTNILLASSRSRHRGLTTSAVGDVSVAVSYASVVDMVVRHIPWDLVTCLPRSLTLWWLLRRSGIESQLRIGVRREGERLVAHAWIVCRGTTLGETPHEPYTPLQGSILSGINVGNRATCS